MLQLEHVNLMKVSLPYFEILMLRTSVLNVSILAFVPLHFNPLYQVSGVAEV